jgi:hypothetical protein
MPNIDDATADVTSVQGVVSAYNCIMRNDAHSAKCIDSPSNYVKVNAQQLHGSRTRRTTIYARLINELFELIEFIIIMIITFPESEPSACY